MNKQNIFFGDFNAGLFCGMRDFACIRLHKKSRKGNLSFFEKYEIPGSSEEKLGGAFISRGILFGSSQSL